MKAPRRVLIGQAAHAAMTELLRQARPELEIRGKPYTEVTADDLEWAETYVGFKRPLVPTMGNVSWVHCTGAGVDAWLIPDELSRDILLTRTSESFGPMIAEWVLARMLAFSQQLLPLAREQAKHAWSPRQITHLRGSRAVVVGTGDIGSAIAGALTTLGVTVHGVSRSGKADASVFARVSRSVELPSIVGDAQWLIVTVPLTRTTRSLIGREVLSQCRDVVLLNSGRGEVVDESIIPEALERGWLRGAALDVFEQEPLPAGSPLWEDPRVMISPHLSGQTTVEGAVGGFVDCLAAMERGETPPRVVDRDRGY